MAISVQPNSASPLILKKTESSHRNMSWFYETPLCDPSVFHLPPYLELYYQVFREAFVSENEEWSRYIYLCWLVSGEPDAAEINKAKRDAYILGLLNKPYDNIELFGGGVVLSNFHYYFYLRNVASFNEWGFALDTPKGRQAYLVWCYTRGIENNDNYYLTHTKEFFLGLSDCYKLGNFDVTKIFEMILVSEAKTESLCDPITPLELEIRVAWILFNYNLYRYPLTDNQINQLLANYRANLAFDEFWRVHRSIYVAHSDDVPVADMDIHPTLKQRLMTLGATRVIRNSFIPQYLYHTYRTFRDSNLPDNEDDQELGFLCWLLSDAQESVVVNQGRQDHFILDRLNKPHDRIELFKGGVFLTTFHYYFFHRNRPWFGTMGLTLGTIKECQKFFVWCYTHGVADSNNYYLSHTKERFLEMSDCYKLSNFDVTKIFEMILVSESDAASLCTPIDPPELEVRVSWILFNYAQYCYPLTDNQILQLLERTGSDLVFDVFWRTYRNVYIAHDHEVNIADMDIHPALKQRILNDSHHE